MKMPSLAALVLAIFALMQPISVRADIAEVRALIADHKIFDAYLELRDLAPKGDPEAQYMLAGMYHWGDVGAADFQKALYWYERAAKQGHGEAMIGLAILYAQDQGSVKLDRRKAYTWLQCADRYLPEGKSKTAAAGLRESLAAKMTPEDVAAAEAEAASFQPQAEPQP